MKKFQTLALSFLSAILLWASWPLSPLTFLIFIALTPLLLLADKIQGKRGFFIFAFITLLTWNVATTWWIWNSTDVGSIAAMTANSLIMCLPWWGYRVFKRRFGRRIGYVSLVLFWMAFEYIHLNWQLSWPWLTIGNVFASHPGWVQWYEYTGTSGGTLWVLLMNILLYEICRPFLYADALATQKVKKPLVIYASLILIIPFVISFIVASGVVTTSKNVAGVVIIQPNVDPYGKFDESNIASEVQQLINLSESKIDSSTRLVIWPETALSADDVFENRLSSYPVYKPVFDFVKTHPTITLVSGIESWQAYGPEKLTPSARLSGDNNYYDNFNAAVQLHAGDVPQFYHKSRLVPGVETLPDFLRWMAPVFEKFGGTTGGYGRQKEASVLAASNQPFVVAPIICYESIFGEYVGTYVQKGANLLAIMTNDGWWGNTPGHKQHLQYARLRAIETRRWVARSANTGISAVIDNLGNIQTTQPWDVAAVIKYNIPILEGETFYVRYGDILSKVALVLATIFFAWNLVLWSGKIISGKKGPI